MKTQKKPPPRLAANLTILREKSGLTQEGLATILGVTRAWVSKIETGHGLPSLARTVEIANVFKVTIDRLVT